ncbi:MAG: hypothetical protein WKG06_00490 [Segetibacter sp.]
MKQLSNYINILMSKVLTITETLIESKIIPDQRSKGDVGLLTLLKCMAVETKAIKRASKTKH